MASRPTKSLREVLKDADRYFFFLGDGEVTRLDVLEIGEESMSVDLPMELRLHRTVFGFMPSRSGDGIFKIEGSIEAGALFEKAPKVLHLNVDPSHVQQIERRRYRRITFTPPLEAEVMTSEHDRPLAGRILNISPGGFHLESDEQLAVGSLVRVRFQVACQGNTYILHPEGTILYATPVPLGYAYGVKFTEEILQAQKRLPGGMAEFYDSQNDLMEIIKMLQGH